MSASNTYYYYDNDEGDTPPPSSFAILLENDSFLLLENDGLTLLENGPGPTGGIPFHQEDLISLILQEDNSLLFLED